MASTEKAFRLRRALSVPEVPYFSTPSSVVIELTEKAIINSPDISRMANRFQNIRHTSDKRLEVFLSDDNSTVRISQTSKDYTAELILPSSVLEKGLPGPTKKLFRFLMTKVSQDAFINGNLVSSFIEFNLVELVETGFYNSVDSARNHIGQALDSLLMFIIGGTRTVGKGRNKKMHSWDHGNIFINHSLKNNIVRVDLNTKKDWNFIISQFQIMPYYLYSLSSRAYDLCEAIFYYARVNAKRFLDKEGVFTINNRIIQQYLSLPDVNATKNPGRDIKEVVVKAVDEINSCEEKTDGFSLELYNDPAWSVSDWVSQGYMTVHMGEMYLKSYRAIAVKRAALIKGNLD